MKLVIQEVKEKSSVGTYTHPKDMSKVQRVFGENLQLTDEDDFIRIVETQPRVISTGALPVERSNSQVLKENSIFVAARISKSDKVKIAQAV